MVGQRATGIAEASVNKHPRAFAETCNDFFRKLGCQFSGHRPGLVFEEMAEQARCPGLAPSLRSFVCRVILPGYHFRYPGVLLRALDLVWGMLDFPPHKYVSHLEFLAAQERAMSGMRIFCRLAEDPHSSVSKQAFTFLEEFSKRCSSRRSYAESKDDRVESQAFHQKQGRNCHRGPLV